MISTLENATIIGNEFALSFADGCEAYLPFPCFGARVRVRLAKANLTPWGVCCALWWNMDREPLSLNDSKGWEVTPSNFFGRMAIPRASTAYSYLQKLGDL